MAFQGDSIYWVEVEKVVPNPFQPRREFDQNKLQELSESIRMYGVLQPLTVTRSEVQRDDGTFYTEYELIAGERRLRASKLAGSAQVPVIIREGHDNEQEKLELAIIENLQREDLNAVDRAIAFKQLAEQFSLSHAQVAKKVGRSREYVSNTIRLLGLPEHMLESLKHGDMMEGHARTLLMLTDRPEEQEVVYKEILLKKLSVREVERIVRKIATDKVRKKNPGEFDAHLIELEKRFTETLGTRVQIQKTDFGGKLTIDYFSEDDLDVIFKRIRDEESKSVDTVVDNGTEKLAASTPLEVVKEEPKPKIVPQSPKPIPEEKTPPVATDPTPAPTQIPTPTPTLSPTPAPALTPIPDPVQQPVSPIPTPQSQAPLQVPQAEQSVTGDESSEFTPTKEPESVPPTPAPSKVEEVAVSPTPEETNLVAGGDDQGKQSHSVEPEETLEQSSTKATKDDDSDLYSIKNFTV